MRIFLSCRQCAGARRQRCENLNVTDNKTRPVKPLEQEKSLVNQQFMVQYGNLNSDMDAKNHFKKGASLNNMMSKGYFLLIVCFVLLAVFCGCDKEDDKSIDTVLIGKWEIHIITFNGKTYDLTDPDNPLGVNNGGYEFTNSKMRTFFDGSLVNEGKVYTKGSKIHNTNAKKGINWQVSGNTLTLNYTDTDSGVAFIEVCQKVSEFSWE